MTTLTCEICGKEFSVRLYRKDTARFCGKQCGGKWHMQNREMPNDHKAGNKYRQGKPPTNAFQPGHNLGARLVEYIELTCHNCGKVFTLPPNVLRHKKGNKRFFCSTKCQYEANKGEGNSRYLGGPMTYRGRNWQAARLLAVARDKGTCQDCGRVIGESIPVHHIHLFREFASVAEANQIDNLVCLCQSCHMKREAAALVLF